MEMESQDLIWLGIGLMVLGGYALLFRRDSSRPWWGIDFLASGLVVGGGYLVLESRRDAAPDEVVVDRLFSGVFDDWYEAMLLAVIAAALLILIVIIVQRSFLSWQRLAAIAGGAIGATVIVRLWENGLPTFSS
jgi:hypothetical protein